MVSETPQTAAQAPEEEEVPPTLEERTKTLEDVVSELIDRVEKVTTEVDAKLKNVVTKSKGLFGGKRTPTPTKDLKTGKVYPSKAAVGKAFAAEAGADPLDSMAYYKVMTALKMPDGSDRFVDAGKEEGEKARAEQKAQIEKEVAEANARLQAEEAAKAKAAQKVQQPQKGKK